MTRIAVLTSGGDAPGINAAIRAVVKVGAGGGVEVFGVEGGFDGLIENRIRPLTRSLGGRLTPERAVDLALGEGGTLLGSSRSAGFMSEEGRDQAARVLADFDGLVVIGGNGSLEGAHALATEREMVAWRTPVDGGVETLDSRVHRFPLARVSEETAALTDGSSAVMQRRMKMMEAVEGVLAL